MIKTSEQYNPYSNIRDVDVNVEFDVLNRDAAKECTFSVSEYLESITQLNQLNDGIKYPPRFATCENGLVSLDGTFSFLNDTLTKDDLTGWWSKSLSNDKGEFTNYPTLTINLKKAEKWVGFSLYSSHECYIKEAIITTYLKDEIIYSEIFTANSPQFIADLPVESCDKVIINITKTNAPYRRVKLCEFEFGICKIWTRNNITNFNLKRSSGIYGESLPISKFSVEFDNSLHEFDISRSTKRYVYYKALKDAKIQSNSIHELSRIGQLKDEIYDLFNYATCEDGFTSLDGSFKFLPNEIDNSYEIGYLSYTLSDENCLFLEEPYLDITWDKEINFSGLRLFFSDSSYASIIYAIAYKDDAIINEELLVNDSNKCLLDFGATNCNRIKLYFNKTDKPFRYVKISEVQILRYSDSWFNYLSSDYPISAKFIINGEEVNLGDKFYFEEVNLSNGNLTAQIVAHDYIYNLDSQIYKNGKSGRSTLDNMLKDILDKTNIEIVYGQGVDKNFPVSTSAPSDTTKRAALHYVSQAAKCTCWIDRDGKLKVQPLDAGSYVDTFDYNNLYNFDIIRLYDEVNMIRLTVKDTYTDPETSKTFFGGSSLHYREMENDCIDPDKGQEIADWLLSQRNRRLYFEMEHRGNPALEIGDTIRIVDKNGFAYRAVVYEIEFDFENGLKSVVKAVVDKY